jgi:asparagine synthase (glutamine-hydrolysing)
MCGIIGIVSNEEVNKEILIQCRDVLAHRGPDDSGIYISPDRKVGLGHTRLSIIDLSLAAHQPISNENEKIWAVYNGEIYNFLEIRKELEQHGHIFKSNTDSEFIIHSYEEWGEGCVKKFRGMFAFGLWDETKKRLFLARDRIGIKPLYYFFDEKKLVFASELKAIFENRNIPRQIDFHSLNDYLTYGYIPFDRSIYKKTKKLPAGHTLVYKKGELSIKQYWDVECNEKYIKENELLEKIEETLEDAIRVRLISDVPLGVFLSGGIDSSTVTSFMSKLVKEPIKTFSIGFDISKHNEIKFAKTVAQKFMTDHHEKIVTVEQGEVLLPMLSWIYDEPFYDSSSVPTFYVSKFARENVTVVLSGDGGDEVFGGYIWYEKFLNNQQKMKKLSLFSPTLEHLYKSTFPFFRRVPYLTRLAAISKIISTDPVERYFRLMGFFDDWEKGKLLGKELKREINGVDPLWLFRKFFRPELPSISALRYLDQKTYLVEDILVKVDRASMANSLEVRVPLLDHKLIEVLMQSPAEHVFKDSEKKYLLKKLMMDHLPQEIITRKKKGFSIPVKKWFQKGLLDYAERRLLRGEAVNDGLFNFNFIKWMVKNKIENRWAKLWLLIVFEEWYRRWIAKKP